MQPHPNGCLAPNPQKNLGNEGLRLRIDEPAPWFSTDPAMYNRKKKQENILRFLFR
jgi:hypothetical protein